MLEAQGLQDTEYNLVGNADRYSISNLIDIISDFGVRSMRQAGFTLPYWENAARMVEDYLVALMIITIALLIALVISLIRFIVWLWCGRTWRTVNLRYALEDKIAERGSRKDA